MVIIHSHGPSNNFKADRARLPSGVYASHCLCTHIPDHGYLSSPSSDPLERNPEQSPCWLILRASGVRNAARYHANNMAGAPLLHSPENYIRRLFRARRPHFTEREVPPVSEVENAWESPSQLPTAQQGVGLVWAPPPPYTR
ncbi:hypothetical protein N7478_007820 [Penicillium angulare]|uniref:uncharacterized protein n=1 Tax=Penicillium angulare TaxID=116970 RepID=UPI002541A400|nr:uncharacterized protein N7478_007820 [Penicillium angulare]KAJ5272695.1 hypothetical protein N7478_007820 [Penicillium angulare]